MKPRVKSNIGQALRSAREASAVTQEQFDSVSSRVYISAIERGLKVPTITKIDDLAAVLGVHPLTLLAMAYLPGLSSNGSISPTEVHELLKSLEAELMSFT